MESVNVKINKSGKLECIKADKIFVNDKYLYIIGEDSTNTKVFREIELESKEKVEEIKNKLTESGELELVE